ncbi:MAG: hypothetical protein GFH27_549301n265 [Chloroflexi bacterium AL-W]|nr:hypothetical protein [Chloroflexi bacterium AL-N1]NOK68459.1 hypothetical protein [Chloroflexi bacterium AL-N10]NOK74105.1 hypothetical protein [Chloroflexi bacterium AL-N5]NOK83072.1 hypothetical protein [Chloroflexi bacterium AL-W]NOK90595.1 hypothetical protein [Chloroflexi bacterium AL-N15]
MSQTTRKKEKIFNPYMKQSIFVRPFQFYGDYKDFVFSQDRIENANIYFIVERLRIRFIPEKISVKPTGEMRFVFNRTGRNFKLSVDFARILLESHLTSEMKRVTSTTLFGLDMSKVMRQISNNNKGITAGCVFDIHSSSTDILKFTVFNTNGFSIDGYLSPHGLLSREIIDFNNFSQLLYVGKSKDISNRSVKHEKILQALAECSDDKDIYLFFCEFDENQITLIPMAGNRMLVSNDSVKDIDKIPKIELIEMCLINYFKPLCNEGYKYTDIINNKKVDEYLKANEYTKIVIETDHDHAFWRFGSDFIQPSLRHEIIFEW